MIKQKYRLRSEDGSADRLPASCAGSGTIDPSSFNNWQSETASGHRVTRRSNSGLVRRVVVNRLRKQVRAGKSIDYS
jgi:hypothetical protein